MSNFKNNRKYFQILRDINNFLKTFDHYKKKSESKTGISQTCLVPFFISEKSTFAKMASLKLLVVFALLGFIFVSFKRQLMRSILGYFRVKISDRSMTTMV